jgi:hypothetical protein
LSSELLAKFLSTKKILSTDYPDYTDSLFRTVEIALSSDFFKEVCVIGGIGG